MLIFPTRQGLAAWACLYTLRKNVPGRHAGCIDTGAHCVWADPPNLRAIALGGSAYKTHMEDAPMQNTHILPCTPLWRGISSLPKETSDSINQAFHQER